MSDDKLASLGASLTISAAILGVWDKAISPGAGAGAIMLALVIFLAYTLISHNPFPR